MIERNVGEHNRSNFDFPKHTEGGNDEQIVPPYGGTRRWLKAVLIENFECSNDVKRGALPRHAQSPED